ncbi:MAG TPA: shikimate dehydrogenase [Firmicutes bacterium]|nr:shikimate dehydrogenase [Bacillota bacterium]
MSLNKYAIIGFPLGHSMSPFIHRRLFDISGISAEYDMLEIRPEELENKFELLRTYSGFNVTIPHKINIIKMCDNTSGVAKLYSSVNCVKCGDKIIGYNTDAEGFLKTFEHYGVNLFGKVLILGAGGVARTALYECAAKGCRITIAARESSITAAKEIAAEASMKFKGTDISVVLLSELSGEYDIIINATPVGMYPNIDAMPVQSDVINGCGAVFDLIYNPGETKLLKTAKEMGKKAMGGMPMLVWQAAAAHKIWYGADFSCKDINTLIDDSNAYMYKHFRH